MNQAQKLLSGMYSEVCSEAKGKYMRYHGALVDGCWVALLVYAVIGGINAILCVWAIAWDWLR